MPLLDRIPIRAALAGVYAIALAVGYALFAVVFYTYLGHTLRSSLDSRLVAEIHWVESYLSDPNVSSDSKPSGAEGRWPELERRYALRGRDYSVGIFAADGRPVFRAGHELDGDGAPPAPDHRIAITRIDVEPDDRLRVASQRTDRYEFRVAAPERPILDVERHTLFVLLALAPLSLLGSVGAGWVMAGAALRPLGDLTQRAQQISASRLDQRIPDRRARDELSRLVQVFNEMVERLEHAFDQINDFSSNAAHELRTPLTILRGEAELAMGRELTPEQTRELVAGFHEETIRMVRIVDDLLTLARADRGRMPLDLGSVDVAETLRDTCEDASILASDKRIDVRPGRIDAARVRGDAERLRQLLRALISNAVRYTPEGGTIRIEGRIRDGDRVEIAVEDTGIGIPPEHLPHIFDRFYRVDPARSRERGGAGLGLALARWIAEAHGGTIRAASEPGKGSRFVVDLPLESDPPART